MSRENIKELILEGLDCADCASKIESGIKKLPGVEKAEMNFTTKILTMEIKEDSDVSEITDKAKALVLRYEPDVIVREKIMTKSPQKTLYLVGLDCANCANKIEHEVRNLSGVKSAHMDFVTGKLTVEAKGKKELQEALREAVEIINRLEPDVKIREEFHAEKAAESEEEAHSGHTHGEGETKWEWIQLGIGGVLFLTGILFPLKGIWEFIIFFMAYLIVGGEVLLRSLRNISRGQIFDENFLMAVATIGAFAIGQYPEGVAVMLFYQIGELFQGIAVNRSRKSISALMDIRPDYGNLIVGDEVKKVDPNEISVGDYILVKPGERVPMDGQVTEGESMLDTSALTGESVPRKVVPGENILGGTININGVLKVKVEKEFNESTVSKILDLVEHAGSKKAPTENFITKFARYYTPFVVFAALGIAVLPPLLGNSLGFHAWIYRALVFLVVSCPCALVVSIPLGFFGGIGGASHHGILIKGSNYLEALNKVDTVVFDKTGTLTKGVFTVTKIVTAEGIDEKELLMQAAYAETFSTHPVAVSIQEFYGEELNKRWIESYDEVSGHGIKAVIKGREVLTGNARLMDREKISYLKTDEIGTIVHVAIDRHYAGYLVISDEIKEDAAESIKRLKKLGITRTVMLTGDIQSVGDRVAKELGIDEVYAELLPDKKVEKLEELEQKKIGKGKIIFVGDGINDAPVLARADIGFAMGGLGSDAAIEAADVVIMTDEPSKIADSIRIAKKTRRIVWQNIFFAFAVKALVLMLGASGLATMWEAVFADVGVTIIAVFNAMRVLKGY